MRRLWQSDPLEDDLLSVAAILLVGVAIVLLSPAMALWRFVQVLRAWRPRC